MTGSGPGAWRAPLGGGRPGSTLPRVPLASDRGVGPCRPAASVTRREKAGQTRYAGRVMQRRDAPTGGVPGPAPILPRLVTRRPMLGCLFEIVETLVLTLIIFLVIQTFVAQPYKVQQQSMEQHAGARPVRPGRQADAPLRHLQARRHRRLHAARPTGSRTTARRSSSASSASAATRSRSADGDVFVNGTTLDEPYIFDAARRAGPADDRPGRREPVGRSRPASCS